MRIPENEQEIVYLFSKYHEKLGFSEITRFDPSRSPDCYAIKDGKEVGIEIEFKLSKFSKHYFVEKFPKPSYDYKIKNDKILIFHVETPSEIEAEFDSNSHEIWDKQKFPVSPSLWIDGYSTSQGEPLVVKKKTLKDKFQFVVCWEADMILNDNIEVIELRKVDFDKWG